MCGRYYIDSDMAEKIETVVRYVDQRIRKKQFSGDIRPTEFAPVIEKSERGLKLDVCKWGYPLAKGNTLVINARTESVMDKIAFRNGLLYHRILIPASGFYEWNRLKEKNTFTSQMLRCYIWRVFVTGLRMKKICDLNNKGQCLHGKNTRSDAVDSGKRTACRLVR